MRQWTLIALSLIAGLGACGIDPALGVSTKSEAGPMAVQTFQVCGKPLDLEIARSRPDQRRGLMYRDGLDEGKGMLFIFVPPKRAAMWMRNVTFPIEIGFFDRRGRFLNYHYAEPGDPEASDFDLPLYRSDGRTKYVVEASPGFFSEGTLDGCVIDPVLPE
ncbi:MAG: DUF192 domain-containing protein [Alphaproteobacteria bacterium]